MKIALKLSRVLHGDTALKCYYPQREVLLAGEEMRDEEGEGACENSSNGEGTSIE